MRAGTELAGAGRALRLHGSLPEEIESLSMSRLRALAPCALPPEPADSVALRMAYAAGDASLLAACVVSVEAVVAVVAALAAGAPVIADVAMVAAGTRGAVGALGGTVLTAVEAAATPLAQRGDAWASAAAVGVSPATIEAVAGSTRTARGLLALAGHWEGTVIAIGNAPTALLALLDALADGAPRPAAIVATPCGYVAAAEAKDLLLATPNLPAISVRGTRGGSAVAAAAINACARLAAG